VCVQGVGDGGVAYHFMKHFIRVLPGSEISTKMNTV